MTSTDTMSQSVPLGAKQAAQSVWVARLGRFGLASRGVLYIVLAYLAVRVAFGRSNTETDQQGALHTIAREPFGEFLLVVLALGFAGYALWQLSKAALGGSARAGSDKPGKRSVALIKKACRTGAFASRPWPWRPALQNPAARAAITNRSSGQQRLAGVFVTEAALTFDPKKARGIDVTLKSFAHTAAGPWLLVLVAAGLLAYGFYALAQATYADI
jgi:hypothetical protein